VAVVGLSVRQLERRCRASFDLDAKGSFAVAVFSIWLQHCAGFSSPSERDFAELRYFDRTRKSST
jgi:hypothetical protein